MDPDEDQPMPLKPGTAIHTQARIERIAYEYARAGAVDAPTHNPLRPVVDALNEVGVPAGAGSETADIVRRRIERARGDQKALPKQARRPGALTAPIFSPEASVLKAEERNAERREAQSLQDRARVYFQTNRIAIAQAAMTAQGLQLPVTINPLNPDAILLLHIWLAEHAIDPNTGQRRPYAGWEEKVAAVPRFMDYCALLQPILRSPLSAKDRRAIWNGIKREAEQRFHAYIASDTVHKEHPAEFVAVWRGTFLRRLSLG